MSKRRKHKNKRRHKKTHIQKHRSSLKNNKNMSEYQASTTILLNSVRFDRLKTNLKEELIPQMILALENYNPEREDALFAIFTSLIDKSLIYKADLLAFCEWVEGFVDQKFKLSIDNCSTFSSAFDFFKQDKALSLFNKIELSVMTLYYNKQITVIQDDLAENSQEEFVEAN